METYTEPKKLVGNPYYQTQRRENLRILSDSIIDKPLIEIVTAFNKLPYCFTLQSCYGHFVYSSQKNSHNLEPLPVTDTIIKVEYRIAYIAFCLESNASSRELIETLRSITAIDPNYIQFCSAKWFWKRQINSYALQVEPDRYKTKDRAIIEYQEALHIEKIRNEFFIRLGELL